MNSSIAAIMLLSCCFILDTVYAGKHRLRSGQCKADFIDSEGDNCQKYIDERYCKPNGICGENWDLNEWGSFSDYEMDGYDTNDCPGCGCGSCPEGKSTYCPRYAITVPSRCEK